MVMRDEGVIDSDVAVRGAADHGCGGQGQAGPARQPRATGIEDDQAPLGRDAHRTTAGLAQPCRTAQIVADRPNEAEEEQVEQSGEDDAQDEHQHIGAEFGDGTPRLVKLGLAERQAAAADQDLRPVVEGALLDGSAVDQRSIRAAKIIQDVAAVLVSDLGVEA